MNPNTSAGAVGWPGGGVNLKAMRLADPQYWLRKNMAEDLKNAKLFLQQGMLTAETLDNFDLWKEDIVRAVKLVSLTGTKHWATVNWLKYNGWTTEITKPSPVLSPTTTMN